MDKLIGIINRGLSTFCIVLSSFLVACVVWQVFSRYVLNAPSTTTDELARFLFIWVGLMGAAYTLGQKRHLAIELLEQILENKPTKLGVLRLVINIVSVIFASVIMIYGGGETDAANPRQWPGLSCSESANGVRLLRHSFKWRVHADLLISRFFDQPENTEVRKAAQSGFCG